MVAFVGGRHVLPCRREFKGGIGIMFSGNPSVVPVVRAIYSGNILTIQNKSELLVWVTAIDVFLSKYIE